MKKQLYCVHGFFGKTYDWSEVLPLEKLAAENFGIQYIDLQEMISEESIVFKLDSFSIPLEPSQSHYFVGYSMGARLVMNFLARQNKIKQWKFLNFSGAWGLDPMQSKEDRVKWDQEWAKKFRELNWQDLNRQWNSYEVFSEHNLIRKESDFDREALAKMLENWSPAWQKDLRPFLREHKDRIRICLGEKDQKYRRLYQDFEVKIIPNSGHRLLWEQPQACLQELQSFLFAD